MKPASIIRLSLAAGALLLFATATPLGHAGEAKPALDAQCVRVEVPPRLLAHQVFERYEPWFGALLTRPTGSLVADRTGQATSFAMFNLQERGTLFVEPTTDVYEGMIVGENSRGDDLDVNITKERKLTNVRSSTAEELERLVPPRKLSLEQALEFCRDSECVEVTPNAVRLRKVVLGATERAREAARRRHDR